MFLNIEFQNIKSRCCFFAFVTLGVLMRSRWLAKPVCISFFVFSWCVAIVPTLLWADEGNCAHAALRHSLMREHNKPFGSQRVISQFPPKFRDKTPVPIYVLSDVASKMGLRFDVVKLDPHKPTAAWESADRKSTRLNSSHVVTSRMPSSA